MPIKNYTTSIKVEKTVMEIQHALAKAGAQAVLVEYEGCAVSCISFRLRVAGDFMVSFRLPGRVDGVLMTLQRQKVPRGYCNREQAARVAWRIVKDWVTAQLAFVEAEIAGMAEVFLPYADAGNGETLYQKFVSTPGNLLGYTPES